MAVAWTARRKHIAILLGGPSTNGSARGGARLTKYTGPRQTEFREGAPAPAANLQDMFFGRRGTPLERPEWLIVGLGNPGMQYSHTRHNIGFRAATLLAERHKIRLRTRKFKALYGYGTIEGTPVVIALPMTYMNLSGNAVGPLLRHYDLGPDRLLVIADDLALPLGRIRIRPRGSGGGQRGLEHIIQTLGTEEFARLRIGIDPANPGQAVEHVLSAFHRDEQPVVKEVLERVVAAVRMVLREGLDRTMNEFNRKGE